MVVNGAAGARRQLPRCSWRGARGARVIGTASESNHDYLRSLGAEPTTYGDGLADRVRALAPDGAWTGRSTPPAAGRCRRWCELTGDPQHVVTIADYQGAQATGRALQRRDGDRASGARVARHPAPIEAGSFTLPVTQSFPLDEIGEAHRVSEPGHVRGKLVVLVN